MIRKFLSVLLGLMILGGPVAYAKQKKKKEKEGQTLRIDEAMELKAKFLSPSGANIQAELRKQHVLLISPRRDFVNEIIESAEDL